jgi:RNA polymerase sigma-70 factor (ECF subfamily)
MTSSLLDPPALNRCDASSSAGVPDRPRSGLASDELAESLRMFGPRLHAVARRYFPCEADAADAVQDALVAAVRHLPQFQQHSRLETWLHRIVVNACLMRLRTARRRPTVPLDEAAYRLPTDGETSPLDREETRQSVRRALRQLTTAQQTVIRLRYFEGFNTAETAELLGLTTEVVKTRLHRSCRALRGVLEAGGDLDSE